VRSARRRSATHVAGTATQGGYLAGVLALAHSLRQVQVRGDP